MCAERADGQAGRGWAEALLTGLLYYYLTSLVVVLGVALGYWLFRPGPEAERPGRMGTLLGCFAAWDGEWYAGIVRAGYSYDPGRHSNVAFYPLYPLLARAVAALSGMGAEAALLLVAHVALAAAFVLLYLYVRERWPEEPAVVADYVLLAFGLFPTSFFFRMTYSESLFMLLALLAFYGIVRGWRPVAVGLVVGLSTATRSVGLALLPPLILYTWQRWRAGKVCRDVAMPARAGVEGAVTELAGPGADRQAGVRRACEACRRPASVGRLLLELTAVVAIGSAGLGAFILHQYIALDEPLAFVEVQHAWNLREASSMVEKLVALVTLEPIRAVFAPGSPGHWTRHPPADMPIFNLTFLNPLIFVMAIAVVLWGWWPGWLNRYELLLAAGLLGLGYWGRGYELYMESQARFAAVVFPVYLVLGRCLSWLPAPVLALLAGLSGALLAIYAAEFATWYFFI